MIKKTIFDDGFQSKLTEGAVLVGEPGIPMLMDLNNAQVPRDMIPFGKAKSCKNKRQHVHFYMHDREFSRVLYATNRYIEILKLYDGVVTPDCSMLIGQSPCLQQANTYMNRAVGFYLQKNGISVIPNIRWSDEDSFKFCFLGVSKGAMVSVSTHGCISTPKEKEMFKLGLDAMLDSLEPQIVLVHGFMPEEVFGKFCKYVEFHRYASMFERTHKKEDKHGNGV